MAYDPGLNRLIALGGTYNPSFVDEVSRGRAAEQGRQMNNLTMQASQQQMGAFPEKNRLANLAKRQSVAASQQQTQAKQMEEYGTAISPILNDILKEQDPNRQQIKYQQSLPVLEQAAQTYGVPMPQGGMPTVFDDKMRQNATMITQKYGAEQFEERYDDQGNAIDQVSTKSNRVYTHPQAPSKVMQGTPEQFTNFSRGAQTQLDKDLMTQSKMRDSINILNKKYKEYKGAGYSKNKITSWASSIGNLAEGLGVPLPAGWSAQNASHDDLMVASGRVFDAYRKIVTGSQAAVAELERFLVKRVPDEGDAETRFEAKLQAVIEFDEIATIRLSRLKRDGWVYAGTSGEGESQTAMVSKNGQVVPISQAMSLDMIPMYTDRRNQIMTDLAKGRAREDIPAKTRKNMAQTALKRLKAEGYNVDARMQ